MKVGGDVKGVYFKNCSFFYSLANEKNVLRHYLNNHNESAVKLFHRGMEIASERERKLKR